MPRKKKDTSGGKDEETIMLTEGSEYVIQSLGSREAPLETCGTFRGYTMVGTHSEGICIELDKTHKKMAGKIRVIPTHMLLTIDIRKEAKKEEDEAEDTSDRSYM